MSSEKPRHAHAIETNAVHGPHVERTGSVSTPIVHSATFTFDSLEAMVAEQHQGAAGSFYQRRGHPTIHAAEERLEILADKDGVWRCRTIFNCTDACPRGIHITQAILEVSSAITGRRI